MISSEEKQLIIYIDEVANKVIDSDGGGSELMVALHDTIADWQKLMASTPIKELEVYFQEYEGFFQFTQFLTNLSDYLQGRTSSPPTNDTTDTTYH